MRLAARVSPAVLLAALVAVAYGGSLRNELVFDELMLMERDPRVRSLEQVDRIFLEALWSTGEEDRHIHQYYRPLQLLPLTLSYAAFGTAAWPTHLLNLVLHFANCLLVLGIFRRLIGHEGPALLAAVLFTVHPGHSEAVLWASDVAGLGAAFATLAIFRLHLSPRRERWYGWLLTPLLFLCGLWFKESGALAPALVGLYDLLAAEDRGWRRVWRMKWRYLVFLPPYAVYLVLRLRALGGFLPGLETVPLSRGEMLLNAVALLPEFAATFLWPFDLNMYHDFNAIQSPATWPFVGGALMLLACAALCALTIRSHPLAAFGALWSLAAAAPHLLIRWPQLNVFAERYLYLPAAGLLLAAGYAWSRLSPRAAPAWRRGTIAGAAALVALFVIVDVRRTGDWHDEVTIYGKTLTQSARAELIRTNLAVRFLELGRFDDGIAVLEELRRINPEWRDTWYNLGLLHMRKGDADRAIEAFEEARQRAPHRGAALLNLGYLYDQKGRRQRAVEMYLRLVELEPRNTAAWYNLAVVAFELGQLGNARQAVEQVLAQTPHDADARRLQGQLAVAYAGAAGGAARPLRARRQQRRGSTGLAGWSGAPPQSAPAAVTWRRCEAARKLFEAGRPAEAIIQLKAAAWLDEASPQPHHFLANIFYLTGRLADAVPQEREAVARAPGNELYRGNLVALEAALAAQQAAAQRRDEK